MAEELDLQGENVVRSQRTRKYPIENAVRHIERGTKDGDKVVFTNRFHMEPGDAPKVIRTLAYNPETDERLVEVGTLSGEAQRVLAQEEDDERQSSATTILRAEGQA